MVNCKTIILQGVKPRLNESCFVIYHSEDCSSCGFLQPVLLLIICIAAMRDQERKNWGTLTQPLYISNLKEEIILAPNTSKVCKPMQKDSREIVLNRRKYGSCSRAVMQPRSIGPCKTSKEAAQYPAGLLPHAPGEVLQLSSPLSATTLHCTRECRNLW